MKFGEIIFYFIFAINVIYLTYRFFFSKTEHEIEKEYKKKLKEGLLDEFIFESETDTQLTLEEVKSEDEIAQNKLGRIKPKDELEYYRGKEREIEELANFLKNKGYKFTKLTDVQVKFLEQTKILSKYDDWFYSCSYSFNDGTDFVFFPRVTYNDNQHENGYTETQIMFWIKDNRLNGHVYLREKTNFETLADSLKNDDVIALNNYETFVFNKPTNTILLLKILQLLDAEKDLEIEIIEENLLIKSLKYINKYDYLRIEKMIKNLIVHR